MPDATGAKLALGTVQWGMRYGIAGRGQPQPAEIGAILDTARAAGVSVLDTAHAYGTAERVIGSLPAAAAFAIVTKTLPLRQPVIDDAGRGAVADALEESLTRLQRQSVYAVLVHDAGDLLARGADRLWKALEAFRAAGKARRIGVSVYNPEQCRAVAAAFPVEVIQLPLNIYDQRFLQTGVLADLKARGVEVHTRSAFLQGLLMMRPGELPAHFDAIRGRHAAFHDRCVANGVTPLAAALQFCLQQPLIDRVVVGCETKQQFEEIGSAARSEAPAMVYSDLAVTDPNIVEPSRWPK